MSAHTAYTAPPHSLLVRTSFILLFTISTLQSFSCCFNISLTEYNAKKNVAWEFQDQTSFPIFFFQKWEFKNLKVLMLHFWAYFLQKILFHIFSAINITIYVSPPLCLQARVYLNYSYYLCVHRKDAKLTSVCLTISTSIKTPSQWKHWTSSHYLLLYFKQQISFYSSPFSI